MYTSIWENDSKPQSPQKACGLTVINPQNLSRVLLLGAAVANIVVLLNGGFFSISSNEPVRFGPCSLRGDFFNVCLNGLAVSLVSVGLALLFILKDFIMCALNSISWMRWMQLTEGVFFLLLTVWWAFSAAFHQATFRDLVASNITATVPGAASISLSTVSPSIGLEFALIGLSIGCVISNFMWLLFERVICRKVCSHSRACNP
jgi:hypothetical protein